MYTARAVAITSFILILSGCAGGIGDYRTPGVDQRIVFGPSPSNNYSGRLVEYDPATSAQLINRAIEICSHLGGLRSPPTYSYSVPIGWKVHLYQCNGPKLQTLNPSPNTSTHSPNTNTLTTSKGLDELRDELEREKNRRKELEDELNKKQQAPAIGKEKSNSTSSGSDKLDSVPTQTNRLSIDVAKTKCLDLGFRQGTEGFGKCVLQLSK